MPVTTNGLRRTLYTTINQNDGTVTAATDEWIEEEPQPSKYMTRPHNLRDRFANWQSFLMAFTGRHSALPTYEPVTSCPPAPRC
jgi:hypothetical protein